MDSLSYLVGAANTAAFLTEYLDVKPLHICATQRGGTPNIITKDEVFRFLSRGDLVYPQVRVARGGRSVDVSELTAQRAFVPSLNLLSQDALFHELSRRKSTLIIQAAQFYFPQVAGLIDDLHERLLSTCHVNIYVTPPQSAGFGLHWDNHDVFVVQVEGQKCWEIYDPITTYPRPEDVSRQIDPEEVTPYQSLAAPTLSAGDCLYLPRGYVHKAQTAESTSVHATIGFQPTTWADILGWLVERGSITYEALRRSCPADHADLIVGAKHILDEFVVNEEPSGLADEVRTAMLDRAKQSLPERLGSNWVTSVLAPSPDRERYTVLFGDADIEKSKTAIKLELKGKRLALPVWTDEVIQSMTSNRTTTVADLATRIEPESASLLVKTLAQNGFLRSSGQLD